MNFDIKIRQVLSTRVWEALYLLPRRDQERRRNKAKCDNQSAGSTNIGNNFRSHKFCNLLQNQIVTHFKSRKANYFHFQKGVMPIFHSIMYNVILNVKKMFQIVSYVVFEQKQDFHKGKVRTFI